VNLDRALISGQLTPDLLGGLAYIVALTAIFFTLSLITMRRRLIK